MICLIIAFTKLWLSYIKYKESKTLSVSWALDRYLLTGSHCGIRGRYSIGTYLSCTVCVLAVLRVEAVDGVRHNVPWVHCLLKTQIGQSSEGTEH